MHSYYVHHMFIQSFKRLPGNLWVVAGCLSERRDALSGASNSAKALKAIYLQIILISYDIKYVLH